MALQDIRGVDSNERGTCEHQTYRSSERSFILLQGRARSHHDVPTKIGRNTAVMALCNFLFGPGRALGYRQNLAGLR